MADGTGAGERYLIDPDSLRHSSSRFSRHSKAMADLRQGLLTEAAETPRYSNHDPQVASFVDRLLRVGDAIKDLEQFYGEMADEIVDAAAKAEAAEAMVADSASLGEYGGLVITAFGLNQQISNWSEVDGLQAQQRLVEKRSNYYKAWGFNPDTVEFSPVHASAYLEGAAAAVVRRTGQNPDRVKAILASHMVEAGVVTNGEAWLGQTLAIKVESSGIDNDTFRTIGVIIADNPKVSTAFYNQLGAQESAALPNRILRGNTPPHDDLPPEYQTVKLFATGLAKATNTSDLEFNGDDLTDNAATNLSPGGLAVHPGYLFDTDELFNPSFAVDAASSALIDRNNAPPAYDLNDQPMAFILEAVVRNGPEATTNMADGLGEDMALFFRSINPILDYDTAEGDITARVFASLAQSEKYGPTLLEYVIYHAGSSIEPLDPSAAAMTSLLLDMVVRTNPAMLQTDYRAVDSSSPTWVQSFSSERAADAVTAIYLGVNSPDEYEDLPIASTEASIVGLATATVWQRYENAANNPETTTTPGLLDEPRWSITDAEAEAYGTSYGVLVNGRWNAERQHYRFIDEANAEYGHTASSVVNLTTNVALAFASPIVAIPASTALSEVYGPALDHFYPTDAELGVVLEQFDESTQDFARVEYLTAKQLAATSHLFEENSSGEKKLVDPADLTLEDFGDGRNPDSKYWIPPHEGETAYLDEWLDLADIRDILIAKNRKQITTEATSP